MNDAPHSDPRRHWGYYATATAVFFFTLGVYSVTLTPSCPFWDSGEFIATSHVLGIPHPPGTPLYVIIGRLFSMVPLATIAVRVNWLSALSSALAVLFTFLVTVRFIRYTQGPERKLSDEILAWTGGACAAFFAAFSNTFWESAIEAEVYALSSWVQVLILYLALRWWEGLEKGEGDNRLLAAWYLCFLSVGIHLGTFLVVPAIVLLVLMVHWRSLLSPRNLAWAGALAVFGMSVHLYLYFRAHDNPPINEGDPETLRSLGDLLMRKQYGSRPMFPRSASWTFQFGMYFRYFLQQYPLGMSLASLKGSFVTGLLGAIPIAFGLFGAYVHAARERESAVGSPVRVVPPSYIHGAIGLLTALVLFKLGLGILVAVAGFAATFAFLRFALPYLSRRKTWTLMAVIYVITSLGLLLYLNFTDHEVRERDYFYTSSFHFFAIWIGMGLAFAIEWARELIPALRRPAALGVACVAAIAFSLLPLKTNWFTHDRRDFYIARDYAYNMLAPLKPNSYVLTNGDNDTFPLWYIQQVENFRKDVRVINLSLLNTDWYVKQLRDEAPRVPMTVSDQDLANIRDYGYLPDPKTGEPIPVNHYMVLNIWAASRGRMPGYIAVTVPDHHGLDSMMVLEGLVSRIEDKPVLPDATPILVTGPEGSKAQARPRVVPIGRRTFMDLPAVSDNIYHRFLYRGQFDDQGNFLDHPYKDENARRLSQNYAAAHMQLAYEYRREGDYANAISELRLILRMFPDFPQVTGLLGIFLMDSGDTTGAMKFFRDMSVKAPSSDLYYYWGVALGFRGETDSAVAMLMEAVRLDPSDVQSLKAAYSLLVRAGRGAEADRMLQTLIQRFPNDPEVQAYLQQADTLRRRSWSGEATPGSP